MKLRCVFHLYHYTHYFKHFKFETMQPKKHNDKLTFKGCLSIILIFSVILFIGWLIFGGEDEPEKETPKIYTQAQKDSIWLDEQFDHYDGSNYASVVAIQSIMNNPKSFEHVETHYVDTRGEGDTALRVFTKFRGTNAYGAIVTQTFISFIDTSGNVIDFKDFDNLLEGL